MHPSTHAPSTDANIFAPADGPPAPTIAIPPAHNQHSAHLKRSESNAAASGVGSYGRARAMGVELGKCDHKELGVKPRASSDAKDCT